MQIEPATRKQIAARLSIDEQYLYQIFSGRREGSPELCVAIERATDGAVMRWDLRPNDWHLIWPEITLRDDAPDWNGA